MKKSICIWMGMLLIGGMLTSCGGNKDNAADNGAADAFQTEQKTQMQDAENTSQEAGQSTEAGSGADKTRQDRKIADQSFDVKLEPLGSVSFVSYAPDVEAEPMGDVIFVIEKGGEQIAELEGVEAGNVRSRSFRSVDAVSFPDYNGDGFNDILTVCSYQEQGSADPFVEVRIYRADERDGFVLERSLTEDANAALAKKTVAGVMEFLGAGSSGRLPEKDSWQQAYIDYIRMWETNEAYRGYVLIYLDDDDIPELVQVGDYEAAGCRIIGWYDGKAYDNQLNRLYFSYIEKGNLLCNSEGNMDYYYDLVFRLEKGQLVSVASGYYGAEDNSNVKLDENGEPIYRYEWEGVEMPKDQYMKELNQVYDMSKARDGYEWEEPVSAEEMIGRLENL